MAGWECYPATGNTRALLEQTKEELELLEYQYPNRYSYLKIELKSFISHLESESLLLPSSNELACMDYVPTQESSTNKKKKEVVEGRNGELPEQQKNDDQKISGIRNGGGCSTRRDRVDVVLERARACLCKIQQFKATLK